MGQRAGAECNHRRVGVLFVGCCWVIGAAWRLRDREISVAVARDSGIAANEAQKPCCKRGPAKDLSCA